MKDKLRREFSLVQSPHFKGLLRETTNSPSLCIVKTNIYRALECVEDVLSCMFMENTWQVFAVNASCKCWEWKPAGKTCLSWQGASCHSKGLSPPHTPCAPLLTLLLPGRGPDIWVWVIGGRGSGGTTCKGLLPGIPHRNNDKETYPCLLGSNAP